MGCDEGSCGDSCGCHSKGCGCNDSYGDDCNDMASTMLDLADKAWESLMKEKMKKALEKHKGAKMDKMAQAAVEASIEIWSGKMQSEEKMQEQKAKIMQSMEE